MAILQLFDLFDKAEDEEIEMAAYESVRLADHQTYILSRWNLGITSFLENELDIDVTPIWQSLSRPGVEIPNCVLKLCSNNRFIKQRDEACQPICKITTLFLWEKPITFGSIT